MDVKRKLTYAAVIIKYSFSVIITVAAAKTTGNPRYAVIGLAELAMIAQLSNFVLKKRRIAGIVLNDLLCLLYNAQMTVLFFSNSFIQPVMLGNLRSLNDLAGKALQYGIGTVLAVGCAMFPCKEIHFRRSDKPRFFKWLLPIVFAAECVLMLTLGWRYSPALGYCSLVSQEWKIIQLRKRIETNNAAASDFYSDTIADGRKKDTALAADPNVILIFTEGLSQSIVDDQRAIMPNLAALEANSLNFTGYYNHTFATYRGLSGQLYSGYQLDNLDRNYLISLQDIFSANGYQTAFINTEPLNADFTTFLQAFAFDAVVGSTADERNGVIGSYSDKDAYELLYDTACRMHNQNAPFFLCIYTFGTHVSFDSVDEVYGDGSSRLLNRFYNADVQLGNFLEKFNAGELSEDTLLVFTADHATYCDSDFTEAFPDYCRVSATADEIPLCFYYKGITPEQVEVNGRNSLSLAPTIFDFLDIDSPNYFLGRSLFSDNTDGIGFDTTFNEGATLLSTADGDIRSLKNDEASVLEPAIQQYFMAKLQNIDTTSSDEEARNLFSSDIKTLYCDDGVSMEIIYTPPEPVEYAHIWFSTWSSENDQDDLVCYPAALYEDGTWHATVDLRNHTTHGEIYIHVYGGNEAATDYLTCVTIIASAKPQRGYN